jgi:hypothetical protein
MPAIAFDLNCNGTKRTTRFRASASRDHATLHDEWREASKHVGEHHVAVRFPLTERTRKILLPRRQLAAHWRARGRATRPMAVRAFPFPPNFWPRARYCFERTLNVKFRYSDRYFTKRIVRFSLDRLDCTLFVLMHSSRDDNLLDDYWLSTIDKR